MTTPTAGNGAAEIAERKFEREPHQMLRERIGSTEFLISVHYCNTSKETIEDKIIRLIEREGYDYAG
ncbi:MAG: transposon-encoded TnpW family protein [Clostridiales Family XIII bacterium]|jgi:hypothetical protein|nr:transposon-encoded TnpW family protein [Clostridiales Family XIII bacterium]